MKSPVARELRQAPKPDGVEPLGWQSRARHPSQPNSQHPLLRTVREAETSWLVQGQVTEVEKCDFGRLEAKGVGAREEHARPESEKAET